MKNFHILQKSDILLEFDIVRKISNAEIKNIKDSIREDKIPKKLQEKVFTERFQKYTEATLAKEPVPGIINSTKMNQERVEKLLKFSIYLGKEIKKLKLNKEEESFLIVSLTKLLELGIEDFKKWQTQQQEISENSDGEEMEDDSGEEYTDE